MKKIILIGIAVLLFNQINAQSNCEWADLQWGTQMKRPPGHYWGSEKFGEDLHLSVWRDGAELHIYSTTGNMNLIKQAELDLEHKARKGKWYYERTFRLGGQLYVMTKIKVKSEEKFYYYVQPIDPNSLQFSEEPIQIGEMTFLRSTFKEMEDITISPDRSKFYFGHNNGTRDLKKFWYEVHIFNADLEVIYEDKITIENDEALNTAYIDFWKNGDVAVLAKRVKEKEDRERGKPNYYYTAAVLRDGEITSYKLDLGDNFISGFGITFGTEGEVVMSGYYSNISPSSVNGVFYIQEDKRLEELGEVKYHEFSIEEITRYLSERAEKKTKKKEDKGKEIEFKDYDVHDLISTKNGTYLLGEQAWITITTTYNSNGVSTTTYHYYFMDIMAIKFSTDGEIDWIARVPKYHYSKNDGGRYSSFNYDYTDEKLYLLFNDHLKNHTEFNPKKVLKTPWGGDQSVTSVASIDLDGNVKKGYLYNVKDEALFTKVKESERLGVNEAGFMIMAQKRKNFKLARVTFTD
jgi:hypothetical protein